MIIKVCGLTVASEVEQLDSLRAVQWLGTIFYKGSKRFSSIVQGNPSSSKRVGVFVEEKLESVLAIAEENLLDILQLHGNESVDYCLSLKGKYTLVKAFGITEGFDFSHLKEYQQAVDYFLFDTQSSQYGGSGQLFEWEILSGYQLDVPFILSGGISHKALPLLALFEHPMWVGVDLNSGFESAPGVKDVTSIIEFIQELTKQKTKAIHQ